ncbi:hypothetical protein ACFFMN_36025 [Planobispora siamensis]|uniref:Uncharacterized protein n=1 Tax=Planobispora siamensis TaxID=936338 RepID=A0A8J3SM60_9ACTN|nr:hypothetical protein [Planobispora siamensis]GIH95121.1 hypothetical protein Psi01_57510 [Planobispora siamensis]
MPQAGLRTSLEPARAARQAAQGPSPHPAPPELAEAVLDAAVSPDPRAPADEPEPSR